MIRTSTSLLGRRPLVTRCKSVMRTHTSKAQRRTFSKRSESASRRESTEPSIFQPFAWYSRKLDTHPILTKGISSGLVSGFGDVLGQYISYKKGEHKIWSWDALRTGRFVVLGVFLVAPVTHVWYAFVNKRFPGKLKMAVAKRVFFDQFCFAPLFLPTWLLNLWTLEGRDRHYIVDHMQKQIPTIFVANWGLWIPAMTVNFAFVPGKFQVLFSNLVAVVWNTYLSFSTHHPEGLEGE